MYITSLDALNRMDLALAGGKGANLGAMIRAGLPVPPGFCVTTDAYRAFVAANGLEDSIQARVAGIQEEDPASLDEASAAINTLFGQGRMPEALADEIRAAYRALCVEDAPPAFQAITGARPNVQPSADALPAAQATASALPDTQAAAGALPATQAAAGALPPIQAAAGAFPAAQATAGAFPAVAVRSSATAEDLPDLSFAGQQDTYLNITGEAALLDAVARCWASLWTARAIGYRARNGIDQRDVALAVVVQRMVQSESAGVLFTANPLTGRRVETVIDATLGLGEALVSGMVEPDHYVVEVDGAGERILHKTLGAKARAVRGLAGGGTRVVEESSAGVQALPDAQILALARLGQAAERHFGSPQDVEWAWAGGRLYVLQSRAITSLYPLPEGWTGAPGEPFRVLFSFAHWQGMLQPISPLGQDSFTGLVVGFGRAFGANLDIRQQTILLAAGERQYVNLTDLVRDPTGRAIASVFIPAIDPASAGTLEELLKDPRLALKKERMSLADRLRLARVFFPLFGGILYNLAWPARGRRRLQAYLDHMLSQMSAGIREHSLETDADLHHLFTAILAVPGNAPSFMVPFLLPGIISGMAPLQVLLRMAQQVEDGERLVLELTRGLPNNVTTEMDLKLWAVSRAIHADELAARRFQSASAEDLCAEYRCGRLPAAAQRVLEGFLAQYGMRGVAEIDLLKPRWSDDPRHIIQVLQSYLEIENDEAAPEAVFRRGAETARQAGAALVAKLRRARFGWLKANLANFLIKRVRELGGLRETPKFTIVRMLGVIRAALLRAAARLVEQGRLAQVEDIFFLHLWELQDLVSGRLPGAQELIAQRRVRYARELNRRRVPRMLLSDGTTYYEGIETGADGASAPAAQGVLTGSPVSAGVVEGTVRVVLDPHGTRLLPGEILVCPATDPAWTPLFLAAGALVMEVGGMMTHGSVVAREYGIPAVVGVSQVTTRLKTGQRVRVDGLKGTVQVLE